MSTFEDSRYRWRETYFVLFPAQKRPRLKAVEKALSAIDKRYLLTNLTDDGEGRFESLTLISPDDFAALDVCYTSGSEVVEQGCSLADEMSDASADAQHRSNLRQLRQCDGRFDVLHFEQVSETPEEDDEIDGPLDPGALLAVLGALARLTGGLAVDPQSGTFLSCEED
jgi:hypothetical protein